MVNWGKLTDREYFSVLLSTDILIGVSGNSLDCVFFLVPKSVVVEIIPFDLAKKTHEVMARVLGYDYYRIVSRMLVLMKCMPVVHNCTSGDGVVINKHVTQMVMDKAYSSVRNNKYPSA